MHTEAIESIILAELVKSGWVPARGSAFARKTFKTIVGDKDAFVYLGNGTPNDLNRLLMGEYYSEGRNALNICGRLIPKTADEAAIRDAAQHFASSVDQQVGQTYAVRLLRSKEALMAAPPPGPASDAAAQADAHGTEISSEDIAPEAVSERG